ncbi:hypothetical protein PYCCODRAFT_675062 [Trametes coccinea BRFM310]|uniref:Uncharacterized protein n=1 Tax=Trametes coccinea (strain BRFM310) TaxID=1353009 RepID=A0A1Y2IJ42_TRAC3|nr:hypothetical protein PYCCODRAFT_675062 [Trametes coccinea BRFM310]
MPEKSPVFIHYSPRERAETAREPDGYRERLIEELRNAFNTKCREISEDPGACMDYSDDGYATHVVAHLGVKFVGWPPRIAFLDLPYIPGGICALETIQSHWKKGALTLEAATFKDIARALHDPDCVHPNLPMLKRLREEQSGQAVACTVHHPQTLRIIGEHLTWTRKRPGAKLNPGPRRQRSDVKKARQRPVSNPLDLPLRHSRNGVKTARCVLDGKGEDEGDCSVDDPLEKVRPIGTSRVASKADNSGEYDAEGLRPK